MPTTTAPNKDWDLVPRYVNVALSSDLCPARALEIRKRAISDRDAMLAVKKAARDAETARFAKQEAADRMKHYRASCLVAGQLVTDAPGDCPPVPVAEWPVELHPYVDRVLGELALM